MVESHAGSAFVKSDGISNFIPAEGATNFLSESFVVAEFGEQRLMEEVLNVFGVIKGGGWRRALLDLVLVAGLSGIDALEDA